MKKLFININTFFMMFKQLMTILNKEQRAKCIFLLLGVFVCAFLETLGVSVIIPFVLVLFSPEDMMNNEYIGKMSEIIKISTYHQLVVLTALLIIIVYLVKNLALIGFQYLQSKFHNQIEKELLTTQYKMFMLRPYSFYLNANTAEVLRGLGSDIVQVAQVIDAFIGLASEVITVTMIGVFIVSMDPVIALGLIGIAIAMAITFVLGFKSKTAEFGKKCREIFFRRSKITIETVNGYKEISIYQKKDFFIDEYDRVNEIACKLNTSYLLIMSIPSRAIEVFFISCLLGLACFRIGNSNDNAQFVSLIGAMAVASIRILPSISNISGRMNGLISNRAGLEAAYNNIDQVRKEEDYYRSRKEEYLTREANLCFNDSIEIRNLSFRYDKTDIDILKDINLTIKKNQSIAFVGESGAGKSTLLDVLLGLLIPQKGGVYMDGNNIEDIPFDWANIVGYVPQTVFLLDDSIRRNIAFGVEDIIIDDNKIWECLKQAKLDDFVRKLPEGLETSVGERGIRFSGGQRQRVAIARALYHDPEILVLDEATSALDNETEKEVMKAIDDFHGKMTIIIVAHRLTTVENCDIIYEVHNGKIYRKGSVVNA